MAGINTTGAPLEGDYHLGGGIAYLAELESGTERPLHFKDLGNLAQFTVSVESEILPHFSTRAGLRVKDATVTTQQSGTLSFILEHVTDFENLKYFFSGETAVYTNPGVAGFTGATLVPAGNIVANSYYQVVDASGNPRLSIKGANLTVGTTNATPVTLVENTDYTIDSEPGLIFLKDTAAVTTAITNSEGLTTDYAADAGMGTVDILTGQTKSAVTAALRFISVNANDNDSKVIWYFPKVTISSDGELNLIAEEWAQAPMTGSIELSNYEGFSMRHYAPSGRTD